MGKMKELSIVTDNEQGFCVGCEFIHQFSPHDGGWCKVHGEIKPASVYDRDEIVDKLGGNDLTLQED
jgi:hypothetical protein